ncbi:MAG TPA: inositol monophosphatase family protein [Acidimicrobiales bacterium]|nr:inositol monophosphatase family protein [Acidimicrobiales bacterium]
MSASPAPPGAAAPDPGALVALAAEAAERAVELLVEGLRRPRVAVETKSTHTDMVSEMDRASERLIVSTLLAARPDDGVVGEEGSERAGTSGLRWVVDPLDGTTNYLYGHPGWGVSIAAEDASGVVAGVVADATHASLFTATRGGGARRDGAAIRVSGCTDLATALVGTGFSYSAERRRGQAEVLVGLLPRIRDIRRMGAAAVDLCSVACGRLDAYYERGLAPWDLAAGGLVATEAGAVLTALDGGPVRPDSVLAAGPGIAAPLSGLLRSLCPQDVS